MTTVIPASANTIQVRVQRVRAQDWQQVRCVRLAALADAPDAFGSTLARELALTDADWQVRTENNATGQKSCGFLAFIDDVPCGFVVGVLSQPHEVELFALWVAQNIRRRGTGLALVQAVCGWARERGAQRVSLKVVAANLGAIALYHANGFEGGAETSCGERDEPALRMHKRLI